MPRADDLGPQRMLRLKTMPRSCRPKPSPLCAAFSSTADIARRTACCCLVELENGRMHQSTKATAPVLPTCPTQFERVERCLPRWYHSKSKKTCSESLRADAYCREPELDVPGIYVDAKL